MKITPRAKYLPGVAGAVLMWACTAASAGDASTAADRPETIGLIAAEGGVSASGQAPAAQGGQDNASRTPPEALGAPGSDIPGARDSSTTASSVEDERREFGTSTGAPTASSGMASDPIDLGDRSMMEEMAYANMAEIATGALALDNSKNVQVKQFAQKMIVDHQKAMAQLQTFADASGVRLPSQPDPQHQSAMMKMRGLTGPEFDEAYLEQAVTDHRNSVRQLKRTSDNADNAQLRAMAARLLPIVMEHQLLAERLSGTPTRTLPRDMQTNPATAR